MARSLSPEKGQRDPSRNMVARMASGEFVGEQLVRKAEQSGARQEGPPGGSQVGLRWQRAWARSCRQVSWRGVEVWKETGV